MVVEANPDLIPVIERHRTLNGCSFDLVHRAYHPTAESVRFEAGASLAGGRIREEGSGPEVRAVSLARIVEEYDLSQFDLVSDVEGTEGELVDEELDLLSTRCRTLIVEIHGKPEVRERLTDSGFRVLDEVGSVVAFGNTALD